jgi:hypothetical protein
MIYPKLQTLHYYCQRFESKHMQLQLFATRGSAVSTVATPPHKAKCALRFNMWIFYFA